MKPRRRSGQFLTASASNPRTYRSSPLRELPLLADEPEVVDRIAERTNIRDEPESIGDAILEDWEQVRRLHLSQEHLLQVAAMQHLRPMLALDDRVRDIQRRAKYAGVDLKRETALMHRDIERAKAGNRKPPARVLDRCERLEALMDGVAARAA